VPDRIRRLLDFVVTTYVVRDGQREVDLSAAAGEPGNLIESDKRQAATRELMLADALADPFREGLIAAYRARRAGRAEVPLDDRRPDEDRMADALIKFLVAYDLASSRTEETEPMHYVYYLGVDWPRLKEVAARAGVDVETALHELAARSPER